MKHATLRLPHELLARADALAGKTSAVLSRSDMLRAALALGLSALERREAVRR